MDVALIPFRDGGVRASSCTYRISANVQVIVSAGTRLVEQCPKVTLLDDGAYITTGLVVPHRKRPGQPLLKGGKDNTAHRKVRVEHVIGWMKNYKILRDYRQHGLDFHHAVLGMRKPHPRHMTQYAKRASYDRISYPPAGT